jgi:hypothetical protein
MHKIKIKMMVIMNQLPILVVSVSLFFVASSALAEAMWRYTVRPGDNLITLANQHLINADDWRVLQRLNHINDPYRLPIGSVLRIPLTLVKQYAASAQVTFVSGQAYWQQSENHWAPLVIGKQLGPGAVIATKDKSKVIIQFADGSITHVVSNSRLSLDALSIYSGGTMVDTQLRLQQGQIETTANPQHIKGNQMQVITPSAIAAVRGTNFRVTADEQVTTQETLDGRVVLNAANQAVSVDKGYGSKAEQGKQPMPPVALLPAVDTSSFSAQYQALPITFDLPQVQGAASWVAKVATDAGFNQLVSEAEFNHNQLVFADVPDGQLYLSVSAKDNEGIVGYQAVHAFNVKARPFQPEIVFPAVDAIVREAQPTLQWRAVKDTQQYLVEVSSDVAFNQLVASKQVDGLSLPLDTPLTPGQYYWRVISLANAAHGKLDKGPAMQVNTFSYKAAPDMPDISQLSVNVVRNRVFVRTLPPPNGLSYRVSLTNPFNHQDDVWQDTGLSDQFDFLLREYGKQILYIRHVDSDGIESAPAVYAFDAQPE